MEIQTCPSCNHLNRPGAKFCANCGQALPVPQVPPTVQAHPPAQSVPEFSPQESGVICPRCKSDNLKTATHCVNCGKPLFEPARRNAFIWLRKSPFLWIAVAALAVLILCIVAGGYIWSRINPFDDVEEILSPIETVIGPIDLTSIPEQIETAIQIDLTEVPVDLPTQIPLEIPTLMPATIPGLGIELPHLSDEEEIEIGREAAVEFEAEHPLSTDQNLIERVERIGYTLVPFSQRRNLPYTFKVVDSDEINAFALPGGFIYINRGMLEYVEDDHQLAGVIGHEIAHVALRHSAQLIENLAAAQAAIDLVTASSPELEDIYQDNSTQLAIDAVAQIVINGWGRENELDADENGTIYMSQAAFNPYRIIDLFERMEQQEDQSTDVLALMFATHPPFADRIARIRQTIHENNLGL